MIEDPANDDLQRLFDAAALHLLWQRQKSRGPRPDLCDGEDESVCQYRGPGDLKCAVGAFIRDEDYDGAFEGLGAPGTSEVEDIILERHHRVSGLVRDEQPSPEFRLYEAMERGVGFRLDVEIPAPKGVRLDPLGGSPSTRSGAALLSRLQDLHDGVQAHNWPTKLGDLAHQWGLNDRQVALAKWA